MGDDALTKLNDQLAGSREARGIRGGLGRVKGPSGFADPSTFGKRKWEPAGEDPLYKRFTRGPVYGADLEEGQNEGETSLWKSLVEEALSKAGGEMAWPQLRDEVVKRRRKQLAKSSENGGDETLWPHLALAHIPDSWLSSKDPVVRLAKS
eukprot:TRINITY_DN20006_c0_g1_i1.p2 TRINITY_DN20006_c0_g1~~TRINITY_DN20006_c0_g1_i1.p2  ORF type:complete len:151 (-),score=40.30 TRINITY_DN20006_c0_g1_i1:149-601(-)